MSDHFNALDELRAGSRRLRYYRLGALQDAGLTQLAELPYSIRILLESVLRHSAAGAGGGGPAVTRDHLEAVAGWQPQASERPSVPFMPARVIMQDFTGVPAVLDLAAMRDALARAGGDPQRVNPSIPVDLVIDHSVQVDRFGSAEALARNAEIEFERNAERYRFLHWGQQAFANFRVVPPATGIVHQVNLEHLAPVVWVTDPADGTPATAYPDTLVGTDSHTTMINSLGVLGWGVGGIEAEAALLGQPSDLVLPDVVGMRLIGRLSEGVTATDLTLTVTQMLRAHGVVGRFVEFFGPGLAGLALTDRATIANMAPEYGATVGFFPVDEETLRYLRLTGRGADEVALVAAYCRAQGLFRTDDAQDPRYSATVELDLGSVQAVLAGPKRPQDRVPLGQMKRRFGESLAAPVAERGYGLDDAAREAAAEVGTNGDRADLRHGAVVIAAITSCTNTSNPSVMIGAGLLARNARRRGLQVPSYVKTSLAPGSRVVTDYLEAAGLLAPLAELGFDVVGYGCTTCIGNSGPLPEAVTAAVESADLVAAAVLSGNRNFEGRVHAAVRANYLASPPLVVAYALAGTVAIDLTSEPIGRGDDGAAVYLHDIWPTNAEIAEVVAGSVSADQFAARYRDVFSGNPAWSAIQGSGGTRYAWEADSTYIQEPPFFADFGREAPPVSDIAGARALLVLGDSITTDHISPAGSIAADSPAGRYLLELRGGARRLQLLRRAPRQPRGADARHLREHPHQEPAGGRHRGRRDRAPAVRRADVGVRRGGPLPRRRGAADRAGRTGVRLRFQPRLGGQGAGAARRAGGDRAELRAHPPIQPGRHGDAAAAVPARRVRRGTGAVRPRAVRRERPCRRPDARPAGDGDGHDGRRLGDHVHRHRPDRHGPGGRIRGRRRHPVQGADGPRRNGRLVLQ